MRRALMCRWWEKNNKPFVALLAAGAALAMATLIDASSSTQVEQFGPLVVPRTGHAATALADGRVLITGGRDGAGTIVAIAEIFDPATEISTAVGALVTARVSHTATLLPNGRVLIAGGTSATGSLSSAEIFDPANPGAGFRVLSATMGAARAGHTATLLKDGTVLIAGGDALNTIEEFNPSADTITVDGTMDAPASSTTLLANGKILVLRPDLAGLYAPDVADPSAAFTAFDETSVPGTSILLRSGQTATELPGDKTILVVGGANAQSQISQSTALFNPARIWTDKDDYQPNDPVILSGSGWKANESVYLYAVDSETEAWTYGSTVAADANGEFSLNPYFIVQLRQLGTMFDVSAVGAQSAMQANVTFTDAVNLNSITVGSQTGTAVAGTASSVTYQITASYSGSGTNNDDPVTLSFLGWTGATPAGVTPSFSTTTVTQALPNSTLTLQTSSSTIVAGTYTFTVRGTKVGGQRKDGTGTLTISPATAT